MNSIKPEEINRMLGAKAHQFCQNFLPNGKKNGKHWEVGSVLGEAGQSCKVYLNGDGFYDFAAAEGGDYISLYMGIKGLDFAKAFEECKRWLGVQEPERKRKFNKPVKPKTLRKLTETGFEYLASRGLKRETIEAFKVCEDSLWGKPAIFFPYMVKNNLTHFKQLAVERINGKKKFNASEKTEPVLFGWQTIPNDRLKQIIITEGEIDAMTMHQYGFNALSVPFGGGDGAKQDWIESDFVRLSRFDEILICMDNDEAGDKANKAIVDRLGVDRCRIVKLPHKDANDCLMAGVKAEEIKECIDNAKHVDIDEIVQPNQFTDETIEWMLGEEDLTRGFDTPWPKMNVEWRPSWGELTLVNGINAHGKSQFVNQIAIHAGMNGIKTLIMSMEIPHVRLNERIVRQVTGSNKRMTKELIEQSLDELTEKVWLGNFKDRLTADRLLEVMLYAHKRYNMKVFLIDSLMKCGIGEDDFPAQKEFVERLCDFKNQYPVHIFLVVHPRKGVNELTVPNKLDVAGAGGITNLADNLLTVWRNKERERLQKLVDRNLPITDEEAEYIDKNSGVKVELQKDRNGGNEQRFGFYYKNSQYVEYEAQKNIYYVQQMRVA